MHNILDIIFLGNLEVFADVSCRSRIQALFFTTCVKNFIFVIEKRKAFGGFYREAQIVMEL